MGVSEIPGCDIRHDDWSRVVEIMDTNKNGCIDYTEFIAACMQSAVYNNDEIYLKNAFEFFDKDKNGRISLEELRQTLRDDSVLLSDSKIENLIKEVDVNKDGVIDYKEFIKMMKEECLI
jgi:calcium-dependent protein kinase